MGYPATPEYALAQEMLGESPSPEADLPGLLHRYLEAFGPATVQDFATWSGLTGVKRALAGATGGLRTSEDEHGRELLDVPDGALPAPETEAPVRALPEYDNAILSHADRTRIVADEHRRAVFPGAGLVRATFLVDGVVAGTWRAEKGGRAQVEAFGRLPRRIRTALDAELERLRDD